MEKAGDALMLERVNPLLKAVRLSAGYGGKAVIKDITLTLYEGETTALVGRNACGKTTLLRTLAGLHPMSEGELWLKGRASSGIKRREYAGLLSFLPQEREMLPDLTVADALLMGANPLLSVLESPKAAHRARVGEILNLLEISSLSERLLFTLSQGQLQLVMLGRALMPQAPLMLLDEPDNALDFINRYNFIKKLGELCKIQNFSCLASVHDPNLALWGFDRVIAIANGEVLGEVKPTFTTEIQLNQLLKPIYGNIETVFVDGRPQIVKGSQD